MPPFQAQGMVLHVFLVETPKCMLVTVHVSRTHAYVNIHVWYMRTPHHAKCVHTSL